MRLTPIRHRCCLLDENCMRDTEDVFSRASALFVRTRVVLRTPANRSRSMLPDFPPSNRIIRIFGTSTVSLAGGISLNSPSRVPVNVDSDIAIFPSTCCPSALLGGSSSLVHTVGISLQNNWIGDDTATRRDASSEDHAVVQASLSRVGPARTGFANANRRGGEISVNGLAAEKVNDSFYHGEVRFETTYTNQSLTG